MVGKFIPKILRVHIRQLGSIVLGDNVWDIIKGELVDSLEELKYTLENEFVLI